MWKSQGDMASDADIGRMDSLTMTTEDEMYSGEIDLTNLEL